jgi:hypothetical protein
MPRHKTVLISALQTVQHSDVMGKIWNGMVPAADTNSNMLLYVLPGITISHLVTKPVHTFQNKTHTNREFTET